MGHKSNEKNCLKAGVIDEMRECVNEAECAVD